MAMDQVQNKLLRYCFRNKLLVFGLFLIFALSAVIKFRNACNANAFCDYDEYYTLKVVLATFEGALPDDSIKNIWRNASLDNGNNVLYNFISSYWVRILGEDQLMLRLLSMVCHFLALFIVLVILIKRKVNAAWILAGSMLFTFHPTLHQFSIITRAYSMFLLEGLLVYLVFYEWKKRDMRFIFISALLMIASMLTHYLALLFLGTIFLHQFYVQRRLFFKSKEFVSFIIAASILAVYFFFHLEWFSNIGNKSRAIEETSNAAHQTAMLYRAFSLEMFLQQLASFLSTILTSSQFLSRLAQGVFSNWGQMIFHALSASMAISVFATRKKNFKISDTWILVLIGLMFPLVLSILSRHLTSFSIKYSIVFVGWYCLFLAIHASKSGLFKLLIVMNTVNILLNVSVSLRGNKCQSYSMILDGNKVSYCPSEMHVLGDLLLQRIKQEGALMYQNKEQLELAKTLLADQKTEFKSIKVTEALWLQPMLLK